MQVELLGPCYKTGRLIPCLTGILRVLAYELVDAIPTRPGEGTARTFLGFYPQAASGLSFPPEQAGAAPPRPSSFNPGTPP